MFTLVSSSVTPVSLRPCCNVAIGLIFPSDIELVIRSVMSDVCVGFGFLFGHEPNVDTTDHLSLVISGVDLNDPSMCLRLPT